MFNVNHDIADQLQLNEELSTFPLLWVANAGEDTVSKIDTQLNKEIGRYRTWFNVGLHGAWSGPAPSRTAVDSDGNAYVLNRHFDGRPASLMKILANSYIDRNGNSAVDTATDANNDGAVSLTETKPLADTNANGFPDSPELQDERVAWIVPVGPNNGLGRSLCIGTDGGLWVGLYNSQVYYKVSSTNGAILAGPVSVFSSPYGCAVDSNDQLWSANLSHYITQVNTTPGSEGHVANRSHGGTNYGITVGNGLVYFANLGSYSTYGTYNAGTSLFGAGPTAGFGSGGTITVAVDGGGNVFSGAHYGETRKYTSAGVHQWTRQHNFSESRGTIVDSDGNVWRIHMGSSSVVKYSKTNGDLLATVPVGYLPYTYSDASGLTNLSNTSPSGAWTVIQNSGTSGTLWDAVTWNGQTANGSTITAQVRASDTTGGLGAASWVPVSNGSPIAGVVGQYIEVEVRLTANSGGDSPILYDVNVKGHPPNQPPVANAGPDASAACGADCTATVHLNGSSSTDPDTGQQLNYVWSGPFAGSPVSGVEADVVLPIGTHTITLTVTDPFNVSSTDTVVVTVNDATAPVIASFAPSSDRLWPPNHKMVPITFAWSVTDCDTEGTTCSILSVSSNEPVNSIGDGNTAPDWEIVSSNTVNLRAERQGPNSGRIYTITLRCKDSAGNLSTRTTTVTVPHDQRPSRR